MREPAVDRPPLRVLERPPRAGADGVSLLCVPFAGGGARAYESWQKLLPRRVRPATLRLPGREARAAEPPATDLRALAAQAAAELGPHLPPRFALFGHSMGALLAFEIARELARACGREPACLILSGLRAPDRLQGEPRYTGLEDGRLRAALAAMGGTDRQILEDPELWEIFRPLIRADLAICDTYTYQNAELLSCPLVVYGSRGDFGEDDTALRPWRAHTTGPFAARMFPGDHFYFNAWPEALVADLVNRLYEHVLDPV